MSNDKRAEIMQRLEALLRLRTDRGATEAEMQTAMAMAQKIAFKYRINLDEVNPNAQGDIKVGLDMIKRSFRTLNPDCHRYLVDILNKFFGVKTCDDYAGHYNLFVVGTEMDVDFAIYVYQFLRFTFKKLWEWQKYEDCLDDNKLNRNSFYHGLWKGLVEKMSEEKAAQEMEASKENCLAMVLVDEHALMLNKKFLAEFPNTAKQRQSVTKVNAQVFEAGKAVGKSLSINKAIGGLNARL